MLEAERPAEELDALADLTSARMLGMSMDEVRGCAVAAGQGTTEMGTAESWAKVPNRLVVHNTLAQARARGRLQLLYEAVDRLATQQRGA